MAGNGGRPNLLGYYSRCVGFQMDLRMAVFWAGKGGGGGGGGKKRYWYSKLLNLAILCVPGQ